MRAHEHTHTHTRTHSLTVSVMSCGLDINTSGVVFLCFRRSCVIVFTSQLLLLRTFPAVHLTSGQLVSTNT